MAKIIQRSPVKPQIDNHFLEVSGWVASSSKEVKKLRATR